MLALRAQLQLLRATLGVLGGKDDIFQSKCETAFIYNPKCGANFLPNKHGMTAAHAHEVQIMKALAIQFCIHLSPILRLIVS